MIKLTDPSDNDSPYYVAPGHISCMFRTSSEDFKSKVTRIILDNGMKINVVETPEEIKIIASVR
jgi:hypothetical protein